MKIFERYDKSQTNFISSRPSPDSSKEILRISSFSQSSRTCPKPIASLFYKKKGGVWCIEGWYTGWFRKNAIGDNNLFGPKSNLYELPSI